MSHETYSDPSIALEATDRFYESEQGFEYTEEYVVKWLRAHVKLPAGGRVLDLCCGDGIWSRGMQLINPDLELFGVDISKGGIEKARRLLHTDVGHFLVVDAEKHLPFDDGYFDVIFARGPGLYNQHDMDRPGSIAVIESWHSKLSLQGLFYSIFSSEPRLMGTYTSMEDAKLPFNRSPRKTESVDFRGGKYHHSVQSFLVPFWKAGNVKIIRYSFFENLHFLITRLKAQEMADQGQE